MNNVTLIGRLGQDPEVRYTTSGQQVVNISVAVTDRYKGKEYTSWADCFAFNGTAKLIAEHLTKGREVGITGSLRQDRAWTDQAGQKRSGSLKVRIDKIDFLRRPANNQTTSEDAPEPADDAEPVEDAAHADPDGEEG